MKKLTLEQFHDMTHDAEEIQDHTSLVVHDPSVTKDGYTRYDVCTYDERIIVSVITTEEQCGVDSVFWNNYEMIEELSPITNTLVYRMQPSSTPFKTQYALLFDSKEEVAQFIASKSINWM